MKCDIVLAGVGGQGGLSGSVVIAAAAMAEGLQVKQSEVHGMSQRGGEVQAALRISDQEIASPLIPYGSASIILSFEPLEALRYLHYLSPEGTLVSAVTPVVNFPSYPSLEEVLSKIRSFSNSLLIDADKIAKSIGAARAANMVMVGAASKFLPLTAENLEAAIKRIFASKGERVVENNIEAFRLGQKAAN
ncbi:MAG: indolepyruvate oxidoreductase [Bdellovibrionales bacterium RIFOXYD1_FULL_44_7]|nr:MAG: indolepyruvate oxidoreductase [Bdellovibrionales bacterium RIFOXYD1_FULL_44_7]